MLDLTTKNTVSLDFLDNSNLDNEQNKKFDILKFHYKFCFSYPNSK